MKKVEHFKPIYPEYRIIAFGPMEHEFLTTVFIEDEEGDLFEMVVKDLYRTSHPDSELDRFVKSLHRVVLLTDTSRLKNKVKDDPYWKKPENKNIPKPSKLSKTIAENLISDPTTGIFSSDEFAFMLKRIREFKHYKTNK